MQSAAKRDLEIGDHPVNKALDGKKSSTQLQYPCPSQD